jgi:hypothetical protein
MPTFYEDVDFDIDPDDYISSCSQREIKELIDCLIEEGHIPFTTTLNSEQPKNVMDLEWDGLCNKLATIRLQLSSEDEKTIRDILNKF